MPIFTPPKTKIGSKSIYTKVAELDEGDIDEMTPSKLSLMPDKLLDKLNKDEVLDLLAFLLSRGNSESPMFTKN